jgi:hypothetical protein
LLTNNVCVLCDHHIAWFGRKKIVSLGFGGVAVCTGIMTILSISKLQGQFAVWSVSVAATTGWLKRRES